MGKASKKKRPFPITFPVKWLNRLLIPTIDSANLTFTVSNLVAGTYYTVKDMDGATFTITAGTGLFAVGSDDLSPLFGYRFIKVVSSATQSTGAVTFTFTVKG